VAEGAPPRRLKPGARTQDNMRQQIKALNQEVKLVAKKK
jgi:hypothetical protein